MMLHVCQCMLCMDCEFEIHIYYTAGAVGPGAAFGDELLHIRAIAAVQISELC